MRKAQMGICGLALLILGSCTQSTKKMPVDMSSVEAGSHVFAGATKIPLYPGRLQLGDNLKKIAASHGFEIPAKVSIINVVPSIDTAVCEEQSHILGEDKSISNKVARLTISRDLPMAQNRFAKSAKLTNIKYFSDYKSGSFGKSTGLMMQGKELLARAVIVTDPKGVIKYLQIVRDITKLPNMAKAIEVANKLSGT